MTSLLALLGLLAPALISTAHAQDDAAAGLYTEARQLPLVSQALAVTIDGDEARLHLTQVFVNDGPALGQADYALHLPEGATVEGFGFWSRDRFLQAELQAREEAHAQHAAAAAEGRSTAILDREGVRHAFSVYPVESGSTQQVELTLSLPVEVEGGRRELRLPVDQFLGQAGPTSTVTVSIATERPLADVGLSLADGSRAEVVTLQRSLTGALLATTSWQPLVLHWQEEAPDLDVAARTFATPEGTGIALRIALNAVQQQVAWKRVELVVDGSTSMRRRASAVQAVLDRVEERSSRPVRVQALDQPHLAWKEIAATLQRLDCGGEARCIVLTDAQLPELGKAETAPAELLVLADAHEKAWSEGRLPPQARVYQPGVEPLARLHAQVDEAVLPVLQIDEVATAEGSLQVSLPGPWRVAEGGLLRLHALVPEARLASLDAMADNRLGLVGTLGGEDFALSVPLQPAGDAAPRLRRALYRDQLAAWMRSWKAQPDEALKARIIELSLREGIPTAFTSLQVDDPELSLVAIKPGDPTLTVDAGPGVTDVVAWYPFGDLRRLVREGQSYTDRFLVPRAWAERAYRVEIFERHADGTVADKSAWYVLDEAAPDASLRVQDGRLVVDTGAATPEIGRVEVHAAGEAIALGLQAAGPDAEATAWSTEQPLPEAFTVVVRDRAGNVLRLPATLVDGELELAASPRETAAAPALPVESPLLSMEQEAVELRGHDVVVHLADRSLRFDRRGLDLRSVQLTAALDTGEAVYLGTRGGDLLRLQCQGADCTATRIDTGAPEHPVTGLVEHQGRVVVGILGQGLHRVQGDRLARAPWRIGSRFVTGLARAEDGDLLVGTGYDGLWRIAGDKAVKARFPHDHVAGLQAPGDLLAAHPVQDLVIDSGHGRFLRLGRDRYTWEGPGLNDRDVGAPDLVDLLPVGDTVYVAGFDSGLWRTGPEGELSAVELDLSPAERRLNALALHEGRLWLASEGGLLAVDPDRPERGVQRVLPGAVHDLASGEGGLAVAGSEGLFVLRDGRPRRVDLDGPMAEPTVGTGRYLSVAWHDGALYAGSLDGLARFQAQAIGWTGRRLTAADGFAASWVTALESDGGTLWIGTYADGLWRSDASGLVVEPALAAQWVPPGALHLDGERLWVGGIGMPAAVLDTSTGTAIALDVPVRDVNRALPAPDGSVLLATSEGLLTIAPSELAAR